MSKLFTVAGTSNLEGTVKFRVANGSAVARTKVLERSGHTDIKLVDLVKPMTKEDAIAFVQSNGFKASIEKPVKAVKLKIIKTKAPVKVKTTKEVPAEQILEEVGIVVARNGAPSTNSMEEIAKIKTKNLETMRKVSNTLRALREF